MYLFPAWHGSIPSNTFVPLFLIMHSRFGVCASIAKERFCNEEFPCGSGDDCVGASQDRGRCQSSKYLSHAHFLENNASCCCVRGSTLVTNCRSIDGTAPLRSNLLSSNQACTIYRYIILVRTTNYALVVMHARRWRRKIRVNFMLHRLCATRRGANFGITAPAC